MSKMDSFELLFVLLLFVAGVFFSIGWILEKMDRSNPLLELSRKEVNKLSLVFFSLLFGAMISLKGCF
jgi:LytS/YehU family sensor histidine kinase